MQARLVTAIVASSWLPQSAMAQQAPGGLTVGATLGFRSSPYVGEDTSLSPLPFVQFQGDGFSVGIDGANVQLYGTPGLEVAGIVSPRFSQLGGADADELDGIDRDLTVDAGLRFSLGRPNAASFNLTVLQEVTGKHDGQEIIVDARGGARLGPVGTQLSAGFSWKSDALGTYVYGVLPGEAESGRPEYETGGTITPFLSAQAAYPINQSTNIIGLARVEFLDEAISDSPIVDEDISFLVGIGVAFNF